MSTLPTASASGDEAPEAETGPDIVRALSDYHRSLKTSKSPSSAFRSTTALRRPSASVSTRKTLPRSASKAAPSRRQSPHPGPAELRAARPRNLPRRRHVELEDQEPQEHANVPIRLSMVSYRTQGKAAGGYSLTITTSTRARRQWSSSRIRSTAYNSLTEASPPQLRPITLRRRFL